MIRKTGNRAFAALNRILSLPGSQALGNIDISVAQPTYDLRDSAKSELSNNWLLTKELELAAGVENAQNVTFDDRSDWNDVLRDGQVIVPSASLVELRALDIWIWGFGIRLTTPANFTPGSALFYRAFELPTAAISSAQQLLWAGQSVADDILYFSGRPSTDHPFPWWFPASGRSGPNNKEFLRSVITSTGATDALLSLRMTTAVPGLFPFR